uniref:CRP-I50 n=1 Tax=Mytilus galloprovincialis TaxID=29158 RepID=A0A0K0NJY5_MYTGA|nr:CRP-I50 [Mytilus galloprovincialis]
MSFAVTSREQNRSMKVHVRLVVCLLLFIMKVNTSNAQVPEDEEREGVKPPGQQAKRSTRCRGRLDKCRYGSYCCSGLTCHLNVCIYSFIAKN